MDNNVNKDQIWQARNANLIEYLMSKGVQLKREGKYFRSLEHDSLVFCGCFYTWHSKGEKGNAVDYLLKYCNMTLVDAVKELLSCSGVSAKQQEFSLDLDLSKDLKRTFAYLTKTRSIDPDIVKKIVDLKLISQDEKNNIVFVIKDENQNIVGAELCGTLSNVRFKGVAAGSRSGYGFNIRIGKAQEIQNFYFFESAIEVLSYISLNKDHLIDYTNTIFCSLSGLKINIVENMLSKFGSAATEKNIFSCVNSDTAGIEFNALIKQKYNKVSIIYPDGFKDFNEQLKRA
jgi:transcriptional regulator CtsR